MLPEFGAFLNAHQPRIITCCEATGAHFRLRLSLGQAAGLLKCRVTGDNAGPLNGSTTVATTAGHTYSMTRLTHLDDKGQAHMVDVGDKAVTFRTATAEALIDMLPDTLRLIMAGGHKKGDVFAVARIAGIQAAKKCADL